MNVKYDIIEFIPYSGTIVVKWYCDELPDGLVYAVDLPIVDNSYPKLDELGGIIKQFEPTGQLERAIQIRNVTIPEELKCYIQKPPEPEPEPEVTKPVVISIYGTAEIPK